MFWCPGCAGAHVVRVPPHPQAWEFNGDGNAPTFHPSVLVQGKRRLTDDEHSRIMAGEAVSVPDTVCHSFVRNGEIRFLEDCTHSLAGQTVPLPDFDPEAPHAL